MRPTFVLRAALALAASSALALTVDMHAPEVAVAQTASVAIMQTTSAQYNGDTNGGNAGTYTATATLASASGSTDKLLFFGLKNGSSNASYATPTGFTAVGPTSGSGDFSTLFTGPGGAASAALTANFATTANYPEVFLDDLGNAGYATAQTAVAGTQNLTCPSSNVTVAGSMVIAIAMTESGNSASPSGPATTSTASWTRDQSAAVSYLYGTQFHYTNAAVGTIPGPAVTFGGTYPSYCETYVVAPAGSVPPSPTPAPSVTIPSSLYFAPYVWDSLGVGTFGVTTPTMQTNDAGAYFEGSVTGTTQITLNVDSSVYSTFAAGQTPLVKVSINYGAFQTYSVPSSGSTLQIASGLSTGTTYPFRVYVSAFDSGQGQRFTGVSGASPTDVVRIMGVSADSGATFSSYPTINSTTNFLWYGDSVTEGWRATGSNQPGNNDATLSYATIASHGLGGEYGIVAFSGLSLTGTGSSDYQTLSTSYKLYSATRSRLCSPTPTAVFNAIGSSDTRQSPAVSNATEQTAYQTLLTNERALCGPNPIIALLVEPQAPYAAQARAAVQAVGDPRAVVIDPTTIMTTNGFNFNPSQRSTDGTHPSQYGHEIIAATVDQLYAAAKAALSTTSASPASRPVRRY